MRISHRRKWRHTLRVLHIHKLVQIVQTVQIVQLDQLLRYRNHLWLTTTRDPQRYQRQHIDDTIEPKRTAEELCTRQHRKHKKE